MSLMPPPPTPARDRVLRSNDLPSSTSLPLNPAANARAGSSSSPTPPAAPITLEAALAAHAAAPSPSMAALEQMVSERNVLSSQNTQLWKLIEKQRSGYNQVLKELERVRMERDTFKSRLQTLGENPEVLLRREKEKERALKSSHSNTGLNVERSRVDSTAEQHRPLMHRHQSDDVATPRAHQHSVSPAQSQEPLVTRDRQNSQSSLVSPTFDRFQGATTKLPPNVFNPSTARSESAPALVSSAPFSEPTIPVPNRSPSEPVNTTPGGAAPALDPTTQPLQIPSRRNTGGSTASSPSTSSSSPPRHLTSPSTSLRAPLASSPPNSQVIPEAIISTSPPPTSTVFHPQPHSTNLHAHHQRSATATLGPPQAQPHLLSRDSTISTISLPDEAKRYIANMRESPASSPNVGVFPEQPRTPTESSTRMRNGHRPSGSVSSAIRPSPLAQATGDGLAYRDSSDSGSSGAKGKRSGDGDFTDLGEESIDESDYTGEIARIADRPVRQSEDTDITDVDLYAEGDDVLATPQASRINSHAPAVEDFPLPPSTTAHLGSNGVLVDAFHQPHKSRSQQTLNSDAQSIASSYSQQHPQQSTPFYKNENPAAFMSQPTFRALPLLANDLPRTRVHVSHSSIRPNDRGKEVLSFVILVEPGKAGKDGWKVEKLFSDVLALDQRVRGSVGKTVAKKIASLPDGKLWRDRAPVKADQRKAALENYLQSLINLPVKNKDEVIAFFTSDILREASRPVYQAGYKEGYLTKRGKNFGGWKLRYFVLQGPVLEYYESRGGAHLGSITITGAQIGRQQQKTGATSDSDDDNEYRHAFLIIEAKKIPTGSTPRHVLCAESDEERDAWVEVLVRYVMGSYNEDSSQTGSSSSSSSLHALPRPSTSSTVSLEVPDMNTSPAKRPVRGMSKDDIAKTSAVPISQLAPDANNAKLFQNTHHVDKLTDSPAAKLNSDTPPSADALLSSSLPTSSPFDGASDNLMAIAPPRANSEMGHYPDLRDQVQPRPESTSPEQSRRPRDRHAHRQSYHPSISPLKSGAAGGDRSASPDVSQMTPKADPNSKVKISGPLNGAPIPAGFKFGAKDVATPEPATTPSDRREKAKSRTFWGFPRPMDKPAMPMPARNVFGVPIEEALDVAEIANLPAVVFRCIQYLEIKKADQEEGIYRLSGSSAVIKGLKDRFNHEGDIDLMASDDYWDPHAIAGLLKSFLRELPTSILTRDLHLKFLAVMDFVDPQERVKELSQLIAALPIANYTLLRALTAHLILIVQNSGVNKMNMRNVGIVFSPTLGIPAGVFSLMLGEFNRVFNVNADLGDEESPLDEEGNSSPVKTTVDRRNSRQYADAAADELLGLSGRTLKPPDEDNSDDGDELSVHDESGAETMENEIIIEGDSNQTPYYQEILHPADAPTITSKSSKASSVAASRGLNVTTGDKSKRQSRMLIGLPASPRPGLPTSPSPRTPRTPQHHTTTPSPPSSSSLSPMHTPK
ncbi:hypothetical protein JAAARDRAFT_31077 [Jaapia argillacea MUCL 33604]|uniref:RhoGAP-domain-containing protein n=1 Tax=Jaapia argillacea MUCL 33604 TaxID=933084 RepID=A0A067QG68_9AGAM|nr:hypothetical protein JAAARDRAFT_31077 [Jaapia argillacea MUCL 33604]